MAAGRGDVALAFGQRAVRGPEREPGEVRVHDRVLVAAEDGSSIADIADRVHLSRSTVRNYLSSAIGKTGTRNKVESALLARRNGWL